MFFKVLNYWLEPHGICMTLEKSNSPLRAQELSESEKSRSEFDH